MTADRPVVIDVHAHLVPTAAFSRLPDGLWVDNPSAAEDEDLLLQADGRVRTTKGVPAVARDLALHRARQEAQRVDVSLLSPWSRLMAAPSDAKTQAAFCSLVNDELCDAIAGVNHSRFLAGLPDSDGPTACAELERNVARGALGGVINASPIDGSALGRDDLFELWQTAERLGVPIVVHPSYYDPPADTVPPRLANAIGYPLQTTIAATSLITAGVPNQYPDLRLVLVHGGGFLPYQFARINAATQRRAGSIADGSSAVLDAVQWFYYDSILFDPRPLRYLVDLVGVSHVLAGSDCPFNMSDDLAYSDRVLDHLDATELDAIRGGNAASLFHMTSEPSRPALGSAFHD